MVNNRVKSFIVMALITALILAPFFYTCAHKTSIHEATYKELIQIDDIGDILAHRVLDYLSTHKNATIDDLTEINGIGQQRLDNIKLKFK